MTATNTSILEDALDLPYACANSDPMICIANVESSNSSSVVSAIAPQSNTSLVVVDDRREPEDIVVDGDFDTARTNIKTILDKGQMALDGILDLASASEHPRTYEVVGQLIKTLVDANKDLLGIHKQIRDLKAKQKGSAAGKDNVIDSNGNEIVTSKTVNNAFFLGTTADLQKIVNGRDESGRLINHPTPTTTIIDNEEEEE